MSNIRKLLRSVKTSLRSVQSVRFVKAVCGLLKVRVHYISISLIKSRGETVFFSSVFFILENSLARLDSAIQPNHKELDTYSKFVVAYEEVLSPVPPSRFYR